MPKTSHGFVLYNRATRTLIAFFRNRKEIERWIQLYLVKIGLWLILIFTLIGSFIFIL